MKKTVNIEPFELDDNDTVCGYKIKDVCLIAKCMEASGVTEKDVRDFVKEFQNAADTAKQEFEKIFLETSMRNHINSNYFGGEDG